MKKSIYIFSDTIIKRKSNTLFIEKVKNKGYDDEELQLIKEEYLIGKEEIIPTGDKKYIPVESIGSIYAIGSIRFNSRFLYFLSHNNIPLHIINYKGNYSGSFLPSGKYISGSILLKQTEIFKDYDRRLKIAKAMIDATIGNQLMNMRYHANRGVAIEDYIEAVEEYRNELNICSTIEEVRGIEGVAKKSYFETWKYILKYPTGFYKRLKNPPPDMINSLISYGNAILYGLSLDSIYNTRLYPEIGFVHEPGDGKLSLSYDIADIFKPLLTDRIIFKMINKNILSEKDFFIKNGMCIIKKEGKRKFTQEFENKIYSKLKLSGKTKRYSYKRLVLEECYKLVALINEPDNVNYTAYISKW